MGGADSALDSTFVDRTFGSKHRFSRWMGWRLRFLVASALLGCIALLLLARWLGEPFQPDATWRTGAQQRLELAASNDPALAPFVGQALTGIEVPGEGAVPIDALVLQRSARWLVDDTQRQRHRLMHDQLSQAFGQSHATLTFSNHARVTLATHPRGVGSLGAMFWLLSAVTLVLYLMAMVVVLAKPSMRNMLYATMALCQSGNLVFAAIESTTALSLPSPIPAWSMPLRASFDLVTAAAAAHAAALYPRRLRAIAPWASASWACVASLALLLAAGWLPGAWWWCQLGVAALCMVAVGLFTWSYRAEHHPFALVVRRFGILAVGTWGLLTMAIVAAGSPPQMQAPVTEVGPVIWYVFVALLLLALPFMTETQQVLREFLLLAAVSTIATSLDLLFVTLFSLGGFASLVLALFLSFGLYSGIRQWATNQFRHQNVAAAERTFENLYRIAREVEVHPERLASLMTQLLRELFSPLEDAVIDRRSSKSRVLSGGATLQVPIPDLDRTASAPPRTLVLRFANRGRRLFTTDDARLANRIVEQLSRAVAFDQAVERGRREERLRLAQDLHDDIGARLLTLMYKAQSPEIENYVRHTLQDLKTLTRGLAASSHPLSHAAAEWKADLTQRLAAAHIAMEWSFCADREFTLSVMQWSALTRVLRELASNAIAHAEARRLRIQLSLATDTLELKVTDDGKGRNPAAWSHGLGLGGVRKRIRQLGGEVGWEEIPAGGICCHVRLHNLAGD